MYRLFFSEKKLQVGSEDCGRDLISVSNLRKKHKRIEAEITAHEPNITKIQVQYINNTGYINSFLNKNMLKINHRSRRPERR